MKKLQIPEKNLRTPKTFYVHEIAAVNLLKIKDAKKICKPNNRDLNRDRKT